MNELAHWIIAVGTGALIGWSIYCLAVLFIRLADAMPNHIPVMTPIWNGMKNCIRKPIEWLDRKIDR